MDGTPFIREEYLFSYPVPPDLRGIHLSCEDEAFNSAGINSFRLVLMLFSYATEEKKFFFFSFGIPMQKRIGTRNLGASKGIILSCASLQLLQIFIRFSESACACVSYSLIGVAVGDSGSFFFLNKRRRRKTQLRMQLCGVYATAGVSCIHAESDSVREGTNVSRHIPADRRHLGSLV